jgi:hypothetical protein
MFYDGNVINRLKKQLEVAFHNATEIAKGAYPTPEQFVAKCRYSFVRNIAAPQLIELCGEQLITDLNDSPKEQMMLLILSYVQDTNQTFVCAETLYKDMKQAAVPVA